MEKKVFLFVIGLLLLLPEISQAERGRCAGRGGYAWSDSGHGRFDGSGYSPRGSDWRGWDGNRRGGRYEPRRTDFRWGSDYRGDRDRRGERGDGQFERAVYQGARSGALSRAELAELREKEQRLAMERERYLADGHLSRNERKDLNHDYNRLYRDLGHELNDGERRARPLWGRSSSGRPAW